mmetsp:Transcript_26763/g.53378  ORF Transcript_26763/g.53378 Transcript_26763/m.53378 type:complete len:269 (+) Transcript_26763:431-1237(+)
MIARWIVQPNSHFLVHDGQVPQHGLSCSHSGPAAQHRSQVGLLTKIEARTRKSYLLHNPVGGGHRPVLAEHLQPQDLGRPGPEGIPLKKSIPDVAHQHGARAALARLEVVPQEGVAAPPHHHVGVRAGARHCLDLVSAALSPVHRLGLPPAAWIKVAVGELEAHRGDVLACEVFQHARFWIGSDGEDDMSLKARPAEGADKGPVCGDAIANGHSHDGGVARSLRTDPTKVRSVRPVGGGGGIGKVCALRSSLGEERGFSGGAAATGDC